jgi:hypothetical protein
MENLFYISWIFFMVVGTLVGMILGHLEEPDEPTIPILFGLVGFGVGVISLVLLPLGVLYFLTRYFTNKFIRVEHSTHSIKKTYYIGKWTFTR